MDLRGFSRIKSLFYIYFTAKGAKTMLLQLSVLCGIIFHKSYILIGMAAPPLHPIIPEATASMQITRARAVRLSRSDVRASPGTTQPHVQ